MPGHMFMPPLVDIIDWNPDDFDTVTEDFDQTTTMNISGQSNNKTLVRNGTIHDVPAGDDGMFIKDCNHIVIQNVVFRNTRRGCRSSIVTGGHNLVIDRCLFDNMGSDGVLIGNTIGGVGCNGSDWPYTQVINSTFEVTGQIAPFSSGRHSIYIQGSSCLIANNVILGNRHEHGISVRNSARILNNFIRGTSNSGDAAGIRYFGNHDRLDDYSTTLEIRGNNIEVQSGDWGIDIKAPTQRTCDDSPPAPPGHWTVLNLLLYDNIINADTNFHIRTASAYDSPPFTLVKENNTFL